MQVKLLGKAQLVFKSGRIVNFPSGKAGSLLGYLITRPGQEIMRTKIANDLWPYKNDIEASGNLRYQIHVLKKYFEENDLIIGDFFHVARSSIRKNVEFNVDVNNIIDLVFKKDDVLSFHDSPSLMFLSEFDDEWIFYKRQEIEIRYMDFLKGEIMRVFKYGNFLECEYLCGKYMKISKYDVEILDVYMQCLLKNNKKVMAGEFILSMENLFKEELGSSLPARLERFVNNIEESVVIDNNRKKDRLVVFPFAYSRIIGRGDVLRRTIDVINGGYRIICYKGAPGVGKTRVCQEVVRELSKKEDVDGLIWISLEDLKGSGSVKSALMRDIAKIINKKIISLDDCVDFLKKGSNILVFDNFEHVIGKESLTLIQILAERLPRSLILISSRSALILEGVFNFEILPLDTQSVKGDVPSATELFVETSLSKNGISFLKNDYVKIDYICKKLEGNPLAIQIVASRTNMQTLGEIKAFVDSNEYVFASGSNGTRKGSMESSIRWSYEILDDKSQDFFRMISILEKGFDIHMIESIFGNRYGLPDVQILSHASLVYASLPRTEGSIIFKMMEPIRIFGASLNSERIERVIKYKLVKYIFRSLVLSEVDGFKYSVLVSDYIYGFTVGLLEEGYGVIHKMIVMILLNSMSMFAFHAEIVRFFEFCMKKMNPSSRIALRVSIELIKFYISAGYKEKADVEKRYIESRLLGASIEEKLDIWNSIGLFHLRSANFSEAIFAFEKYLQIAENSNQKNHIMHSLINLSSVYGNIQELDKSIDYAVRCNELARKWGFKKYIAASNLNLADIYLKKGIYDKAVKCVSNAKVIAGSDPVLSHDAQIQKMIKATRVRCSAIQDKNIDSVIGLCDLVRECISQRDYYDASSHIYALSDVLYNLEDFYFARLSIDTVEQIIANKNIAIPDGDKEEVRKSRDRIYARSEDVLIGGASSDESIIELIDQIEKLYVSQ